MSSVIEIRLIFILVEIVVGVKQFWAGLYGILLPYPLLLYMSLLRLRAELPINDCLPIY